MLKLLAALALPTVVITGTGFSLQALTPDRAGSSWVVWDGRGFSNPDELARWLDSRGVRYSTWARDHPQAAARLENRDPPPLATRQEPERAKAAVPAAGPAKTAASPAASTAGRSVGLQLVLVALLVVAGALVAISVLPLPLLIAIRAPAVVGDRRLELASAGVSIAIGVAVARLLPGS